MTNEIVDNEVRTEIVTITPTLAAQWLEVNKTNRTPKSRQIEGIAQAILNDKWDALNGETIILSNTGELLDGQNRLLAVVKANTPIVSLVVFNVDPTKRGSIDTGFKRTFGDYLSMHGESNASALAVACHVLHAYEETMLKSLHRGMPFISYSEGRAFLDNHPYLQKVLPLVQPLRYLIAPSWSIALFSVFIQHDVLLAEAYAHILSTGEDTEPYPVLRRVRERLLRNAITQAKLPYITVGAYLVKAWNATRMNTKLSKFKYQAQEAFPTII